MYLYMYLYNYLYNYVCIYLYESMYKYLCTQIRRAFDAPGKWFNFPMDMQFRSVVDKASRVWHSVEKLMRLVVILEKKKNIDTCTIYHTLCTHRSSPQCCVRFVGKLSLIIGLRQHQPPTHGTTLSHKIHLVQLCSRSTITENTTSTNPFQSDTNTTQQCTTRHTQEKPVEPERDRTERLKGPTTITTTIYTHN